MSALTSRLHVRHYLGFYRVISCARSTIDWYNAWPRTALHSVAHRILGKLAVVPAGPQECGVGPKMAASLMKISVDVHGGVSTVDKCEFRACGNIFRRVTFW